MSVYYQTIIKLFEVFFGSDISYAQAMAAEIYFYALLRRQLGKTKLQVTIVSLGGVGLGATSPDELYGGVTDKVAIATVRRAVARGINFIDTSPLYRESERRIGLALETLSETELARVHIGTTVGDDCPPFSDNGGFSPFSYDGVMCSIRHSLNQQVHLLEPVDIMAAELTLKCGKGTDWC